MKKRIASKVLASWWAWFLEGGIPRRLIGPTRARHRFVTVERAQKRWTRAEDTYLRNEQYLNE